MHAKEYRRAFTLMECVLALSITAITGLAAAGVSVALANAYERGQAHTESMHSARVVMSRITAMIRKAKLVAAASDDALVLWADDANLDGVINRDELSLLRYDDRNGRLEELKIILSDDMPYEIQVALNPEVSLSVAAQDPDATEVMLSRMPGYATRVLATDVSELSFDVRPKAPMTTLVKIQSTHGQGDSSVSLSCAATLRAGKTDQVGISKGQYVLDVSSEADVTTANDSSGSDSSKDKQDRKGRGKRK